MGFEKVRLSTAAMSDLSRTVGLTADQLKKVAQESFKAIEQADKLEKKIASAASELAKLNAQLEKQGAHAEAGKLGESFTGVTVLEGHEGAAPGVLLTPEQTGRRVLPGSGGEQMAKALDDLSKRIEKLLGPDNFLAKILQVEIPYLKQGAHSADEASAFLQNQLLSWMAGLQQELANPRTPPEERNLILELIHLGQTGNLYMKDLGDKITGLTEAQKSQNATLDRIAARQEAANKFAAEVGKSVKQIEQQVVQGGHTENSIQMFSDHLEQITTGGLGVGH